MGQLAALAPLPAVDDDVLLPPDGAFAVELLSPEEDPLDEDPLPEDPLSEDPLSEDPFDAALPAVSDADPLFRLSVR